MNMNCRIHIFVSSMLTLFLLYFLFYFLNILLSFILMNKVYKSIIYLFIYCFIFLLFHFFYSIKLLYFQVYMKWISSYLIFTLFKWKIGRFVRSTIFLKYIQYSLLKIYWIVEKCIRNIMVNCKIVYPSL